MGRIRSVACHPDGHGMLAAFLMADAVARTRALLAAATRLWQVAALLALATLLLVLFPSPAALAALVITGLACAEAPLDGTRIGEVGSDADTPSKPVSTWACSTRVGVAPRACSRW